MGGNATDSTTSCGCFLSCRGWEGMGAWWKEIGNRYGYLDKRGWVSGGGRRLRGGI